MEASAFDVGILLLGKHFPQLKYKSGFPYARFAHNSHDLAGPCFCFIKGLFEGFHLSMTTDEFRKALGLGSLDSCLYFAGLYKLVGFNRLLFPFHLNFSERLKFEEIPGHFMSMIGHQDRGGPSHAFHPGSQVRGISDGRVIHPKIIPDGPYDYRAGVKAYPHFELGA